MATVLNIFLIACNGSGDNNTDPKSSSTTAQPDSCEGIDKIDICEDAGGILNLIIDSGKAKKMLADFKSIYRIDDFGNVIDALDTAFWMDKCSLLEIAKYLRSEREPNGKLKYDGIRIYFGCEESPGTYPGQQYPYKTSMFIFPTKTRVSGGPTQSTHADDKIKIQIAGCTSPYLQDPNYADSKILAFDNFYRKANLPKPQLKDSLSKSIWIDSCVIFTLAKVLELPYAYLDGANINMAAYNKLMTSPVTGKFSDQQSTIIIVPTNLINGKHENNWAIIDCLFKFNIQKAAPAGFNHGELCPTKCN